MSGDLLSGGTPKRLVQRQGHWVLEVVRQVAIDRSVYRPHTQQIEGPDVILRYLKRNPQFKGLASGATQLLLEKEVSEASCFDAVNGEWIPSVLAPSYIEQLKMQRRRAAQHTVRMQLMDLQAECLRLRHGHASLLDRVAHLEAQLGASLRGAPLPGPAKADAAASTQTEGRGGATAPAKSTSEPTAVTGETNSIPAVIEDAPKAEVAAADIAEPGAPERKSHEIALAPTTDYVRCIEQLIGGDVTAKQVEDQVDFATAELYLSVLIDDDDHEVGAVLMDVKATVFLGGTLLMVPEEELAVQVTNNKPSEDSIAASSEVCNALSGSLNNVDGNPHLRSNFMEALDISKHSWLTQPKSVTYLADSFGGKVMLALR